MKLAAKKCISQPIDGRLVCPPDADGSQSGHKLQTYLRQAVGREAVNYERSEQTVNRR